MMKENINKYLLLQMLSVLIHVSETQNYELFIFPPASCLHISHFGGEFIFLMGVPRLYWRQA